MNQAMWSFISLKREIKYVTLAFLIVLLMPVVAVIVLTQTGIEAVSDALAELDEVNRVVELKNPVDGLVYARLDGPFVWPAQGKITLKFGQKSLYQPMHSGLDIGGKKGDPVTPFMEGEIKYAGEISWGYGKHVIVEHDNNLTSIYAHLSSISVVPGQFVKPGDIIGGQGDTGWATGVHLHFQVNLFGIPVNPELFL